MTKDEALQILDTIPTISEQVDALEMAIKALEQQTCEDAISRKAVLQHICEDKFCYKENCKGRIYKRCPDIMWVYELPSVTQKSGKCKNCKYFEYDSVAKVDGIPLIVAHEVCNKWGGGCKTSEDGYCYLYEPQERSDKCSKCEYYINPDYTRCKECGAERSDKE